MSEITQAEAEKLMAEGKLSNFAVDDKTGRVTIKSTVGPNVGTGSWGAK